MRETIKDAMLIACSVSGKNTDDTTNMIWSIGLKKYSDNDIKEAIINFCENATAGFKMVTPKEFMGYLDPFGKKAAQKRIDETKKLIANGFDYE